MGELSWTPGDVTIRLPQGGEIATRGLIHGEVAIAQHDGEWLVLHRRSGLELGRFDKGTAFDLGVHLVRKVSQNLKRDPAAWQDGFWQRLDEIRGEVARDNGKPEPAPLRPTHSWDTTR